VLTYQKFIFNKKMVTANRDKYGIVFVDECDQSASKCFHQVINGFNAAYRFGCTATEIRKDQLHVIANAMLGPVTARGTSKQMPCKVFYHHTGFKIGTFKMWCTFINRITKDKSRTALIVEKVAGDVERGRYVVVVTDRVDHAQTITRMLNTLDIDAVCFWGGMKNRKELVQKAKDGDIPVVVAIRTIVQRGIDVMYWDSIHVTTPTANVYNYEQEVARIRTPYSDELVKKVQHEKPKPEINFYMDIGEIAFAVKNIAERVHNTLRG
jgi:superfamily II DNA or RNA helicase